MEASNLSFEQTQLQNELEAINFQLNWLYQRGRNDERLVSRKRELEKSSTYTRLSNRLKEISAEYKQNPSEAIETEIRVISSALKKVDASIGKYSTPNGNYERKT